MPPSRSFHWLPPAFHPLVRGLYFSGVPWVDPSSCGEMARGGKSRSTIPFFAVTLVLWSMFVAFEVVSGRRTDLIAVAGGFCFFQASNVVIRRLVSKDPLFVNTSVSLLHSTLVSTSVAIVLINQCVSKGLVNMFEHDQLFGGTWLGAYSVLCFSCGYFAYDQWDMLHYRLYSGWVPAILVHHLILLVCFTLALYRNITINYLILALVCELHSIFLHARKVRRMAGMRDSKSGIVKTEWMLNWFTFFTARLCSHVLITIKLIVDAPKFGMGIELPLALFGMAGMNLLNFFLGLDLFKAYRRDKTQQRYRE